jgi:hypothetical protein
MWRGNYYGKPAVYCISKEMVQFYLSQLLTALEIVEAENE